VTKRKTKIRLISMIGLKEILKSETMIRLIKDMMKAKYE
jgi:hypothetical protein